MIFRNLPRAVLTLMIVGLCLMACTKSVSPQHGKNGEISQSCPKIKGPPRILESQRAKVIRVADGDTFTACLVGPQKGRVKIRVLGIDCPESHINAKCKREEKNGGQSCKEQIPKGKKATLIAKNLLLGKTIQLESAKGDGSFERGYFGRLLSYVRMTDGRDFGLTMVSQGGCEDFGWKYPHPRSGKYQAASH